MDSSTLEIECTGVQRGPLQVPRMLQKVRSNNGELNGQLRLADKKAHLIYIHKNITRSVHLLCC